MNDVEKVARMDQLVSHLWMVRTFLKHSEEAEEDDELAEVHRELYDFMLALGGPSSENDHTAYLKVARKKLKRLKAARDLFLEIQPEISTHTNFRMTAMSLDTTVNAMIDVLAK
ncbi:MAG: amidohydrolase [Planctomycetaceae bacterium]|nr:amidohydrolase [Planctomycetaceae bacterium]MCP4464207.1 amidohydrolase [Planctomycetaceae bacterium]MDG1808292.1 amidohydrolase [Pirellulaceae bacterium]MDG2104322.1 amidohydrolase [Pirellulaceae bacterium]